MSLVRGTRGDLDSIGEEVIDIDDLPPPKNSKETDQLLSQEIDGETSDKILTEEDNDYNYPQTLRFGMINIVIYLSS